MDDSSGYLWNHLTGFLVAFCLCESKANSLRTYVGPHCHTYCNRASWPETSTMIYDLMRLSSTHVICWTSVYGFRFSSFVVFRMRTSTQWSVWRWPWLIVGWRVFRMYCTSPPWANLTISKPINQNSISYFVFEHDHWSYFGPVPLRLGALLDEFHQLA